MAGSYYDNVLRAMSAGYGGGQTSQSAYDLYGALMPQYQYELQSKQQKEQLDLQRQQIEAYIKKLDEQLKLQQSQQAFQQGQYFYSQGAGTPEQRLAFANQYGFGGTLPSNQYATTGMYGTGAFAVPTAMYGGTSGAGTLRGQISTRL